MKSLIIGIARTGSANNYVLNPDTRYISMCGSKPEISFSIDCGQDEFIQVINGLRYDDTDPGSTAAAISFFQNLTTRLFKDLKYLLFDKNDPGVLHIRLVTTPLELAQIPFEFALEDATVSEEDKVSLFADTKKRIVFTREVRQETEAGYVWPHESRVLFAWAAPTNDVPFDGHINALKSILQPFAKPKPMKPYPEPDIDALLTVLPNASLESIKKKIADGIAGKPYTHINILAHGGQNQKFGVQEFRLILCQDGEEKKAQKIDGKTLAKAIILENCDSIPTVVSLCSCDSGNVGNTILSAGSLAYQLHNSGIPCVFASQFPLTQDGSVKLIQTLYHQLINACDPRMALFEARIDLKNEPGHDWASLIAYARFPEDINEQLQDVQLKATFDSMKTTNAWLDHVFKYITQLSTEQKEEAFKELEIRIDTTIKRLSAPDYLVENKKESKLLTNKLKAEHLGLLGSAYKRKAEFLFRLSQLYPQKEKKYKDQSAEALRIAKDFYYYGYDSDITNHWAAMQYLSLKAVLDESLQKDADLWNFIKILAEKNKEKAEKVNDYKEVLWAAGTLTELYMLKPFTVPTGDLEAEIISALENAKKYSDEISKSKNAGVIDSTVRQIDRYISWWPYLNPSPQLSKLKGMAAELLAELNM